MSATPRFLLLLAAAVCFGLGTAGVGGRLNWLALGLLLWVIVPLVSAAAAMP